MSSNDSLLFFSSQSYWLFWFSFPRAPWRSLQQALPPWKEPVQIQRGDQPGDLEDARSPLLHLHIPGYQNSAESCWGLPRLEVCGPSPGRVDKSAAGKRPYIFQGVWLTRGLYMPSQQGFPLISVFFFSQFLSTLSQWCTQTHSLILQNLKPRQRGKKENKDDYLKSTR